LRDHKRDALRHGDRLTVAKGRLAPLCESSLPVSAIPFRLFGRSQVSFDDYRIHGEGQKTPGLYDNRDDPMRNSSKHHLGMSANDVSLYVHRAAVRPMDPPLPHWFWAASIGSRPD
jgi:hypothetical protein